MKKILIIVIIILVVVFGAILLMKVKVNISGNPSSASPTAVPVEAVSPSQLPQQFPADIPLEAGAQVTLNYNATNAAGNFQASREFISKKTIAENYAFYQAALKDNGWSITGTQAGTPAGDLIFATKGTSNLNIRIYTDTNNKVRVSISNEIQK